MATSAITVRPLRTVYFGTPEFAVPTLRALAADSGFDVRLVVTQGGRDASPVARAAFEAGLPVYRPATLRDDDARQSLLEAEADVFVVAAFGLIFRPRTLEVPRLGCINIHPSLLPRYRGATPIMAAIESGDVATGVSLMVMDAGIDTGAIISTEPASIMPTDTTESLGARLAAIGAAQAVRDVPRWVEGELIAKPQPQVGASLTRPLNKADGWIDWSRTAVEIERHVRAMWPWPRAWTTANDLMLQVHRAEIVDTDSGAEPGTFIAAKNLITVACGVGALQLVTVEPAGRRAMSAGAFLNGLRSPLTRLGAVGAPPPQPPLVVSMSAAAGGSAPEFEFCG